MRRISSLVDAAALAAALFERPHVVDGTGMLLLNGQWQGVPRWAAGLLDEAILEIETIACMKVRHVAVNVILPGGGSGTHVDPTPFINDQFVRHSRWHLPLMANPGCWFQDLDHPKFHMDVGHWHGPVSYWLEHAVGNDGAEPRMHLMCDLL